jgi:hypothetical protein
MYLMPVTSYIPGIVRSVDIEKDKIYLIAPLPLHNFSEVDTLFGCSIEIPNIFGEGIYPN